MTASTRLLLLLAPMIGACAGAPEEHLGDLRPGRFVEAKGTFAAGSPLVTEIDELTRSSDDKGDKVEVTAPVEGATSTAVLLLGHAIAIDGETAFENADKSPRTPFVSAAGDWLRIKARGKGDAIRARTIRVTAPRDQFKVVGEVAAVDETAGAIEIGSLRLPLAQDPDVMLLGGRDPHDPLSLFLADDQKSVPFGIRLGENVRLGGQASGTWEWNDEFDLDGANDRDRAKPAIGAKVDALWLLDDLGSYALAEVAAGRDDTIRQNGDDTRDEVVEVTRVYVSARIADCLQVIAGRQDFDEQREWLYDEVLDGVRGVFNHGAFEFELGAAIGRDFAAAVNDQERTGLAVANARLQVDPEWELGAYVLQRTDATSAGFEPLLYGVRSFAQPRHGLGHWLEIGGAAGDDGVRPIRGFAIDVGASYAFDFPLRPTLTAGIAFANGEGDASRTQGYRQSGLQDDNGKLGGVTSVRYYGELFDPELANLTVTTLAAAVRPARSFSVSLLFHTYKQDVAATALPATGLRVQPTGSSRDLGREWDLVFGYRLARHLTVELVAAQFDPGQAFAGDTTATLIAFTTRISF